MGEGRRAGVKWTYVLRSVCCACALIQGRGQTPFSRCELGKNCPAGQVCVDKLCTANGERRDGKHDGGSAGGSDGVVTAQDCAEAGLAGRCVKRKPGSWHVLTRGTGLRGLSQQSESAVNMAEVTGRLREEEAIKRNAADASTTIQQGSGIYAHE